LLKKGEIQGGKEMLGMNVSERALFSSDGSLGGKK